MKKEEMKERLRERDMWGKERKESCQRHSDDSDMDKQNQAAKENGKGASVPSSESPGKKQKMKHRKEGLFVTLNTWYLQDLAMVLSWTGGARPSEPWESAPLLWISTSAVPSRGHGLERPKECRIKLTNRPIQSSLRSIFLRTWFEHVCDAKY